MIVIDIQTKLTHEIFTKNTTGEETIQCPSCSPERKKSNLKCFGFNHDKGIGKCNHCGNSFVKQGNIAVYTPKKDYVIPEYKNSTELSDKAVDWFFTKRAINQSTLKKLKISTAVEWMPQVQENRNVIRFPYFRNGELVNIKYRDGAKNFKLSKDAELIFYNLDAIKEAQECVICEGEIDCLSFEQIGYKWAVSVPNGASKNSKLEYLDNCFEYFEKIDKIYIATDNDEAGLLLRNELARRIGIEKCLIIDFEDCKDANEVIVNHNEGKLYELILKAKPFPIEGVYAIDDVWDEILHIYENGLPQGDITGDNQIDKLIRFMPGELTMITGIPGHGKTIMLDQIALGLGLASNWEFAVCSPESYPMAFYFTRLIKRLTGRKFSKANLSEEDLIICKGWLNGRFSLIKPNHGNDLDLILERAAQLVKKRGIKGLIIDPWNRIEAHRGKGEDEANFILSKLMKIDNFNKKYGVHTFLVAHPTKMAKDGTGENYIIPTPYNISGSAHFYNFTQNALCVFRNFVKQTTELHIQKVKWEHLGEIGVAEYIYNKENARFYVDELSKDTSWITLPKRPEEIQPNNKVFSEIRISEKHEIEDFTDPAPF